MRWACARPVIAASVGSSSAGTFLKDVGAFGNWQWVPPSDYVGVEQIVFTATDALGASTQGTITIAVVEDPLAPISGDDVYNTTVGTTLVVDAADGLFANDTDPDSQWQDMTVEVNTAGLDGTVTVNWDGSLEFQPTPGFNGVTAFHYRLMDDTGRYGNVAKVTIYVGVAPNAAPVAQGDAYSMDQDANLTVAAANGVLANDTDADSDALTVVDNTYPAHGMLAVQLDGSFEYAPNPGFVGVDTFEYSVTDGVATTSATVTITVLEKQGTPEPGNEPGGNEPGGNEPGGNEQEPGAEVPGSEAPESESTDSESTKDEETKSPAKAELDESRATQPAKDGSTESEDGKEVETLAADDEASARDEDVVSDADGAAPGTNAAAKGETRSAAGAWWLAMMSAAAIAAVALWHARRMSHFAARMPVECETHLQRGDMGIQSTER